MLKSYTYGSIDRCIYALFAYVYMYLSSSCLVLQLCQLLRGRFGIHNLSPQMKCSLRPLRVPQASSGSSSQMLQSSLERVNR